jgi:hypothetical protein
MAQDWSWAASARQYIDAYVAAQQRHREHRERLKSPK